MSLLTWFNRFARAVSNAAGSPWATIAAFASVLVWAMLGPRFGFSEDWQLVINTGTTIVTFLMVFLIQHTQNRDSLELHIKLNELIRSVGAARNEVMALENLSDEQLAQLQAELRRLAEQYAVDGALDERRLHQALADRRGPGRTKP